MSEIEFKSMTTRSMGRNGTAITTGIDIYETVNTVLVTPITSKGVAQNAYVEIPREDIPKLIRELKKYKV